MASLHTFLHDRYQNVAERLEFFAIDHSVGRNGRNKVDDVQLIQILLNRVRKFYRGEVEDYRKTFGDDKHDPRLLDVGGGEIGELKVDGVCGPNTMAAILAFQRSVARRVGQHGAVDGTLHAIGDEANSEYLTGQVWTIWGVGPDRKLTSDKMREKRFYGMYILGVDTQYGESLNILEIKVEPLKSALANSSANRLKRMLKG